MAKINDNMFFNVVKKKILNNDFKTKEDLIKYLNENMAKVLNDPFINQEFQQSFMKLNFDSYDEMRKLLLEFYDKQKGSATAEMEGISKFDVEGKDYIKIEDDDGNITILDDSVLDKSFEEQVINFQNKNPYAQTSDAKVNQERIINAMKDTKVVVDLQSTNNTNIRELTYDEMQEFLTVMNLSMSSKINFLVDPSRNIYINKDTGEVYSVNRNLDGSLEVKKVEETSSKSETVNEPKVEESSVETTVAVVENPEPNFEQMADSDLVYLIEHKKEQLSPGSYEKIVSILEGRKKNGEQYDNEGKSQEKGHQYTKKIPGASGLPEFLTTPYNGFVSTIFLASIVGFVGIGFLMLIVSRI